MNTLFRETHAGSFAGNMLVTKGVGYSNTFASMFNVFNALHIHN